MRYFTRFSIKIHLEDSVYSLDDDCIELKIECHFVVRYPQGEFLLKTE